MTASLRAAVIGYGAMGRNHARVLAGLGGVDLVAIVRPSGDPGSAPAPVVGSVAEALSYGLDLAVIAAPTSTHLTLGRELADAGVPALIEKPLAGTATEARELAETFDSRGLLGCVGHIERYNPATRALRQRLADGEVGDLFSVASRRIGPFPNRISDVGVVLDLATHDLHLTAWLTGRPFAELSARSSRPGGREHEDLVTIAGRLADGTVTSHLVSWLSPLKERCTVITGTNGAYVADTLTGRLTRHGEGGERTELETDRLEPLAVELEAFRAAVAGEGTDVVTLAEGARVVAAAEAVLEAARTGRSVTV
ncbi:Gfo/Idh/MocA family protein [Microlunatus sp. GCM10028923]|uniref:Gfo/Idh/MocA family protein n=1 Tax=Microlunatus sp. GCM10028923 TaxID=3273400 RepID=UPI0036222CBC